MNNLSTITSGMISGGNSLSTAIISGGASTALPSTPLRPNNNQNTQALNNALSILNKNEPVALIPSNVDDLIVTNDTPVSSYPVNDYGVISTKVYDGNVSYTGSNLRVVIEVGDETIDSSVRFSKELIELTTLSISVHRAKSVVNSLGFTGAKGYARGRRTIAGTMVLTQFTVDVLMKFLQSSLASDLSKDTTYVKVDQLPLFNLTLFFSNEYGYMSYMRLLGVNLVTTGTVYSTQDQYTEQTISYLASDYTPLLPLKNTAKYSNTNQQTSTEKTPLSILSSGVLI